MDATPFCSFDHFRQTYEAGLSRLLQGKKLGGFVLACANIKFAPHISGDCAPLLAGALQRFEETYRPLLRQGKPLPDNEDDILVLLKIICIGLDQLGATEHRSAGIWNVQFNHLRSFRPRRTAQAPVQGIRAPFNRNGFHFNKAFLESERFWQGREDGRPLALFYNKFPFVDFHALLVPDAEREREQFLLEEDHRFIWQFTLRLSQPLPGVGFGYNAYGAFASVNHLHFQMFIKEKGWPVMNSGWRHNGGADQYPSECVAFDSPQESWHYIASLHRQEFAYNLLYIPGQVFCFRRRHQGTYEQSPWTSGFAWYEMSGGMITFNRQDFETLDEPTITREFSKL